MTTAKIADNKAGKAVTVYPGGELFNAITRMLNEPTPVKIIFAGDLSGDVVFEVKLLDLGLDSSLAALSHSFYSSNSYANFMGEIFLRNNMDVFAERLLGKGNYDGLVRSYRHRNFGLKSSKDGESLHFTFHISLFYNLLNESLSQLISADVAKIPPAAVPAQRVKRSDGKACITTVEDNNNLRLVVQKTNPLRICLEKLTGYLMEHFGIKNKEILVTDNIISFEISISDKANEPSV